jgi:uroporphyrinogen decarboxylase
VRKTATGNVIYDNLNDSISIQKNGCYYFEQLREPYRDCDDDDEFENIENDLKKIMWVSIGTPPFPAEFEGEGLKVWQETARNLRKRTDKAIYGLFGAGFFEIGQRAFGIDNFLCDMALNPEKVHRFLDKLLELHLKNLTKYLNAVGDSIDIVSFTDDLGMQSGPQISPAMYREFFKPRHEILWNYPKKLYPNIKTNLHSCGSIYPFMEDFIENKLDSVNPIQISCKNMEPERLKAEFGGRISFWGGGCDTQQVLRTGTIAEIKEHVKRNLDIFAPSGGYIFQQVHNVMADVRPEALMAVFETVKGWSY